MPRRVFIDDINEDSQALMVVPNSLGLIMTNYRSCYYWYDIIFNLLLNFTLFPGVSTDSDIFLCENYRF